MPPFTETEAKFAVGSLAPIRQKLTDLGSPAESGAVFEQNWRFDDSAHTLSARGDVLRLRRDEVAHLTFKQRTPDELTRTEIDIQVSDLESARRLLEGLGYGQIAAYEKRRETYRLGDSVVLLDELPFGCFVEIEGEGVPQIKEAAESLGLDWARRVPRSYHQLFQAVRQAAGLETQEATFSSLAQMGLDAIRLLGLEDAASTPTSGGR